MEISRFNNNCFHPDFLTVPVVIPEADQTKQKGVDLEKEPWKEPLPGALYIKPYLQNVTQHSIVVMWETKTPFIGHVDYGLGASLGDTISESAPATIHEVEIVDLDPGTTYHYRVRYENVTLEVSTFKTAPPDGIQNCRIIVYGDARSDPKRHRKNVAQMLKLEPDLILHTGDIVAHGKTYKQWQPQHFWPVQIISDKVPIFVTLGNHERNASHHFNYMSLPGNEVYYSFDYVGVHIISLDSNAGATPYTAGTPQYEWLIKDLEANQDAQWIFVMFHHPLFRGHPTRGITPQRYDWHPVFEKYGVDFVFSGHDHYYFRSYPIGKLELEPKQGVRYLTTAGGGARLYPVRDRIYGAVSKSTHHITALDIQGSRIQGRAIDSDGNEFDRFTVTQTPTPGDGYIAYELFEIERDLRKQLAEMKPIVVEKVRDRISIDTELSIPTNFNIRIEGDILWEDSHTWKFSAQRMPFVVNPGATLKIPIKAEGIYPAIYPIPKMTLRFNKLIGRKEGFRNDKLTFDTIKVQPLLPVTVRRIHSPVAVDGKLNEPAWVAATKLQGFLFRVDLACQRDLDNLSISEDLREAFEAHDISLSQHTTVSIQKVNSWWLISDNEKRRSYLVRKTADGLNVYPQNSAEYPQDFVTAQGDTYPIQHLTVMLAHDGQYLYVAAQIEGDPKLVGELLFRVDSTFQSELEGLSLSENLLWEFQTHGIVLSHEATVSIKKADRQWLITDPETKQSYTVKKTVEGLDISLGEGETDRDDDDILDEDEHLAVSLSDGATRLFSIDLTSQSELDNLNLSEALQQDLQTHGIVLSQDATIAIEKKGDRLNETKSGVPGWLITDKKNKQTYTVRKNEGQLNVYRSTSIYTFGVNARGTQIDAKKSDRDWNLDWLSRTASTKTGWITEMAIPLIAFGTELYESQWRIGIRRGDKINNETVLLAASFTITSRENKLPEYIHSISDPNSLSPLSFENLKSVSVE